MIDISETSAENARPAMTEAREWTPGPWRWEVSLHSKKVQLCGGNTETKAADYDYTVIDFVRWGTHSAKPRFLDRSGRFPVLTGADQFAVPAPNREHHASWFRLIDHPDACLIEAAPDMAKVLIGLCSVNVCTTNANVPDDTIVPIDVTMGELRKARAALAKARGA